MIVYFYLLGLKIQGISLNYPVILTGFFHLEIKDSN